MADNIADAEVIDFPTGAGQEEVPGTLADKTADAGDIDSYFYTAWYAVTVGESATVTIHVEFDTADLSYLTFGAYRDPSGMLDINAFESVEFYIDDYTSYFPMEPGETRYVMVAGMYEDYHAPFTLTVGAGPAVFQPSGPVGSFTNPIKVVIRDESIPYVTAALSTSGFPADDGAGRNHPVWFLYVPAVDGTIDFDTELGTQVYGTQLSLYKGDNYVTDTIGSVTLEQTVDLWYGSPYSRLGNAAIAGDSYWLLVSSLDPSTDSFDYVLRAGGAVTIDYGTGVVAPSIDTTVEQLAPSLGTVRIAAPPMDTITELTGTVVKVLFAEPIESSITLRAPSIGRIRRVLGRPADNAVIPVDLPQFTVGVQIIEGDYENVSVDLQGDIAGQLTNSSYIMSQQMPDGLNVNLLTFNSPVPLANGSYQWRARLVLDGVAQAWTPTRTFTVNTAASDAVTPISWTVTGAVTYPHLWDFDPPAGVPGDQIRIFGQGLPVSPTVFVGGVTAPVLGVTHVPATAASTTADRTLADVEHDEIVVAVPIVSPPGGPLYVRGNY